MGAYEHYLAHHGILGQKWGVRRYQTEDGKLTQEGRARYGVGENKDMKKIMKDAQRDAKEYARAKAYYGEGAGNRRKQIKNLTSERMKDPDYKKAFESFLKEQDMEAHQKAANRERKVEDAKNTTVRTIRGVKNFLMGSAVSVTTSAIVIGSALKATGYDQKIKQWGQVAIQTVMNKLR